MEINIVEARPEHIDDLLRNLRDLDKETLYEFDVPAQAIRAELGESRYAFSGFLDNEIVCMWGFRVSSLINNRAYVWLIGTKRIDEHPFVFVRHSQLFFEMIRDRYDVIYGFVFSHNDRAVKWLRWLGFAISYHADGMLQFERRRN